MRTADTDHPTHQRRGSGSAHRTPAPGLARSLALGCLILSALVFAGGGEASMHAQACGSTAADRPGVVFDAGACVKGAPASRRAYYYYAYDFEKQDRRPSYPIGTTFRHLDGTSEVTVELVARTAEGETWRETKGCAWTLGHALPAPRSRPCPGSGTAPLDADESGPVRHAAAPQAGRADDGQLAAAVPSERQRPYTVLKPPPHPSRRGSSASTSFDQ